MFWQIYSSDLDTIAEAWPLSVRTSAQNAELSALTWALQLAAGVWVNTYMDSKYTCTTIYVYRALYKKRGLINSGGKSVKYGQEILKLLEAVWAHKRVVVMLRAPDWGDNSCLGKLNWQGSQMSSPHWRTNLSLTDSCLIPVPLIWMGPMVYFIITGLVWD
jgi:hypothetical protein